VVVSSGGVFAITDEIVAHQYDKRAPICS
jgi:hypothetical protein